MKNLKMVVVAVAMSLFACSSGFAKDDVKTIKARWRTNILASENDNLRLSYSILDRAGIIDGMLKDALQETESPTSLNEAANSWPERVSPGLMNKIEKSCKDLHPALSRYEQFINSAKAYFIENPDDMTASDLQFKSVLTALGKHMTPELKANIERTLSDLHSTMSAWEQVRNCVKVYAVYGG